MKEKFEKILEENVIKAPKSVKLQLPKPNIKKIKLPKKPKLQKA